MSDSERAARLRLLMLRAFSAVLAIGATAAVYAVGGLYGLVVFGLAGAVSMLVGPAASLVSLLVVWTGYEISSCPHCPQFSFRRVGVQHATCAVCGEQEHQIGSTMNGWIHHLGPDEWTCSIDCSNEFREADSE